MMQLWLLALLATISTTGAAPSPPTPAELVKRMAVGINLGNTLDATTEGAWGNVASEDLFDAYKAAGFKSVRVPVRWDEHTAHTPPYTVNATWLKRVAEVVGWSTSRGLVTIVNTHHDVWLDSPAKFTRLLPRMEAIWTQISTLFASTDDALLLFEVYNEPKSMTAANLNALNAAVVPIIRKRNPKRTILFGGLKFMSPSWILANPDALKFPADDKYIALEVHSYDPYLYAQCKKCPGACASPKCGGAGPGCCAKSWGAVGRSGTDHWINGMKAWADERSISLVYGEFGVTHLQTAATDRVKWYVYHRQKALAAGMAVMVWDDNGGFRVLDRSAKPLSSGWDNPVLKALLPNSPLLQIKTEDEAATLVVDAGAAGDDAAEGTAAAPLRSLRAAQAAARKLRSRHPHVTVRLLPGSHNVGDAPLRLGPADAGVTWRSHDSTNPASVGAPISVTGWRATSISGKPGAVAPLPANITKGTKLRHLWVNSKRAARPTGFPAAVGACAAPYAPATNSKCTFNLSLAANSSSYPEGSGYDFSLTSIDPSAWHNPDDVEFVFTSCAGFNCWVEPRCGVVSVKGKVVSLSGAAGGPGMNASCYHRLYYYGIGWGGKPTGKAPKPPTSIENLRSNFSHAGEFYYDRAAATIEYIFRAGETLATLEATATTATKQDILIVNNTHDVAWRDVKFEYATWLGSSGPKGFVDTQSAFIYGGGHNEAWGGSTIGGEPPVNIHVAKSQKVKFSGCSFSHLGAVYALGGDGGSQDLVVFNSSFTDCSGGGIKLGYSGERSLKSTAHNVTLDPALQDRGFLISDNTMEGIPCEYSGANPIFAAYVADTTISHNNIRDSRYSAICGGWGWGEKSYFRNMIIANNSIVRPMQLLADGGGVYTNTPAPGSHVSGNYFEGDPVVYGCLYHDGGSGQWSDFHNVFNNIKSHCVFTHGSSPDTTINFVYYNDSENPNLQGDTNRNIRDKNGKCVNATIVDLALKPGEAWPPVAQAIISNAGRRSGAALPAEPTAPQLSPPAKPWPPPGPKPPSCYRPPPPGPPTPSHGSFGAAKCNASSTSQLWALSPGVKAGHSKVTNVKMMLTPRGGGLGCWEITACSTGPAASIGCGYGCKPLPKSCKSGCDCNGAWSFNSNGTITSVMDGNCLQVSGAKATVGPCTNKPNQQFVVKAETLQGKSGVTVQCKADYGSSFCIDNDVK